MQPAPSQKAAAAHRDENRVQAGCLVAEFERRGADTGHRKRLIEGVHEKRTCLGGELFGTTRLSS